MFSTHRKPIAAYQDVGITSSVASADPHRLIMLLFDGAQAAIAIARGAIEQNAIAEKGNAISKAIDIIDNGLKASLDLERGQDLADRLYALYDYMSSRLLHANLKNDIAALEEVARLLTEIQSAWAEIRPEATDHAVAVER